MGLLTRGIAIVVDGDGRYEWRGIKDGSVEWQPEACVCYRDQGEQRA